MKKIKRTLAWLLAAAILAPVAPITALAANDTNVGAGQSFIAPRNENLSVFDDDPEASGDTVPKEDDFGVFDDDPEAGGDVVPKENTFSDNKIDAPAQKTAPKQDTSSGNNVDAPTQTTAPKQDTSSGNTVDAPAQTTTPKQDTSSGNNDDAPAQTTTPTQNASNSNNAVDAPAQTAEPKDESYGGNEADSNNDNIELDDNFNVVPEPTVETDQYELSNIGLKINGVFVPAVEITDENKDEGIDVQSLIPLKTRNFTLDLSQSGFFPSDMKSVQVSYILNNLSPMLENTQVAVWGKYSGDDGNRVARFTLMNDETTLDLSFVSDYFILELIIGTPDQLNPNNERYVITCTTPDRFMAPPLDGKITTTGIKVVNKFFIRSNNYRDIYDFSIDKSTGWDGESPIGVVFNLNQSYATRKNDLKVEFYEGEVENQEDIAGKNNITSQIYGDTATGYSIIANEEDAYPITVVISNSKSGAILFQKLFYIRVELCADSVELEPNLYDAAGNNVANYAMSRDDEQGRQLNVYRMISANYPKNGTYYAKLKYYHNDKPVDDISNYVKCTAKGYYASVAEAEKQEDVTSQLFGAQGCQDNYSEAKFFTIVRTDNTLEHLGIIAEISTGGPKLTSNLYNANGKPMAEAYNYNGNYTSVEYMMLYPDNPSDGLYYARAEYFYNMNASLHKVDFADIRQYITRTVIGDYRTAEETEGKEDITDQLFGETGYPDNYSGNTKTFTVVNVEGGCRRLRVIAHDFFASSNTSFSMKNARYQPDNTDNFVECNVYKVDSHHDEMADTYQTLFILEKGDDGSNNIEKPVSATRIYPVFETGATRVSINLDGQTIGNQISGESDIPLGESSGIGAGKAVQYTVSSEDKKNFQNYWVTFLTQQQGKAKLFVNGQNDINPEYKMPYREIHMEDPYDKYDILFANIGDQPLTDLYVSLDEDAQKMLKLDDYWTINPNGERSLAPFSSVQKGYTADGANVENGVLPNMAKVRLVPQLNENGNPVIGAVNGVLTIGSRATGEKVDIKLIGTVGQLGITTETLPDGVKFVPYASGIQTNAINAKLKFTIENGALPSPMTINPDTGEIYDVPQVSGEYPFTVKVEYQDMPSGTTEEDKSKWSATKDFTLTILNNTDENVLEATDEGYELTKFVGTQDPNNRYHFIWTDEDGAGVFESQGEFDEFIDLYLDGERLIRDVEYIVERGSTRATIQPQVLSRKGAGSHTLSAEFNKSQKKQGTNMKKASQNYYYSPKNNNNNNNNNGNNSNNNNSNNNNSNNNNSNNNNSNNNNSSSSSSSSSRRRKNSGSSGGVSSSVPNNVPSVNTPSAPASAPMTFTDIPKDSWFFEDVKWAFDNKIMEGVNEQTFAPDSAISQGTIVLTLARMAKVDLDKFKNMSVEGIPSGTWYTEAAIWAKQSGLTKDPNKFTGSDVLKRDEMAVTLVKFLRSLGKDTTAPAQPTTFADTADMSEQGKEAFQILYKMGVFKGVGANRMDPNGTTTRAQFAALLHRLSDTALSQ